MNHSRGSADQIFAASPHHSSLVWSLSNTNTDTDSRCFASGPCPRRAHPHPDRLWITRNVDQYVRAFTHSRGFLPPPPQSQAPSGPSRRAQEAPQRSQSDPEGPRTLSTPATPHWRQPPGRAIQTSPDKPGQQECVQAACAGGVQSVQSAAAAGVQVCAHQPTSPPSPPSRRRPGGSEGLDEALLGRTGDFSRHQQTPSDTIRHRQTPLETPRARVLRRRPIAVRTPFLASVPLLPLPASDYKHRAPLGLILYCVIFPPSSLHLPLPSSSSHLSLGPLP